MLDWDTVRLVLSVHRAGGLSGAARELGVSLPTVSRRLAKAEADLRCVLFDRRQGRLAATEAGRIVIAEGTHMARRMRGIRDTLRTLDASMAGPINVSVPRSLLPYCLTDTIRDFMAANPAIEINLITSDQLAEVDAVNVDVVFRVEENPRPSLWGRRIGRLQFGIYARKDLVEQFAAQPQDLPAAEDLPLVAHDGVTGSTEPLLREIFPWGRIVARCNNLETTWACIAAGMGAGRLPRMMTQTTPDLCEVPVDVDLAPRSLWVLTHKDLRSVRRIAAFIAFVEENFRGLPGQSDT